MELTIKDLEAYLFHHYGHRGNEQGLFMKLIEEIGEVAEVLNMRSGAKKANIEDMQSQLANELADVIHYTVAIAAINGIDLNNTIISKDKKASVKYNHDVNLESFIANKDEKKQILLIPI